MSSKTVKSEVSRAKWKIEKQRRLIEQMVEQVEQVHVVYQSLVIRQVANGGKSDNGYKKQAWQAVVSTFNREFSAAYEIRQLKSQLNEVKYPSIMSNPYSKIDTLVKVEN